MTHLDVDILGMAKKIKVKKKFTPHHKKAHGGKTTKSPKRAVKKFEKRAARRQEVRHRALPPSEAQIQELLKKGRMRGFITENEIFYLFPELED